MLFERHQIFSPVIHSRALFQEFVVDSFICVERGRLRWITKNKKKLKVDKYKDVVKDVDDGIENVGRRIILPSSFIGGPRHMRELYQDAMAMTRTFGPPSLFITMTANPSWEEIQAELKYDEVLSDRPDIGVRVFKMKLDLLIQDLTVHHRLGKMKSWVWVLEFQMRGLPHVHFLGILDASARPNTAESVDDLVCAEIPDPESEPVLHHLVQTHMLHGPCGDGITSPCKSEQGCMKHFPKPFQTETTFPENGYPIYQRRNNGQTISKRGFEFNNGRVVPYNRYLLLRYQCHINVEIPNGIHAYKYLYKYITKGHDRSKVQFHIHPGFHAEGLRPAAPSTDNEPVEVKNEVKDYSDMRWISAYEGKKITASNH